MYQRLKQKGIHHVCLRVRNLEETRLFYEQAFDAVVVCEWRQDENEDHAYIMDLGIGDFLEIFGCSTTYGLGIWQHVAIWTDDIEESFRRALNAGATVHALPAVSHIPARDGQIVHMKYGFLNAPGGEIVELIQDIPADMQQ